MIMLTIILLLIYLGLLGGGWMSYLFTRFVPPRGLWKLVPFRVSGWKSPFNEVYKVKWVWSEIDFSQ